MYYSVPDILLKLINLSAMNRNTAILLTYLTMVAALVAILKF